MIKYISTATKRAHSIVKYSNQYKLLFTLF